VRTLGGPVLDAAFERTITLVEVWGKGLRKKIKVSTYRKGNHQEASKRRIRKGLFSYCPPRGLYGSASERSNVGSFSANTLARGKSPERKKNVSRWESPLGTETSYWQGLKRRETVQKKRRERCKEAKHDSRHGEVSSRSSGRELENLSSGLSCRKNSG